MISDITPKINESFKLVRSSDGFYKGDKSIKVKKSFEFIIQHLDCDLNNKKVLDIGCAGGDFLRYIKNNYKGAQLFGCDVDDTLLDHAKSNSTDITFFKQDIRLKVAKKYKNKFDIIFMSGVHQIFDTLDYVTNLIDLSHDTTKIMIFGLFNPEDLDVLLRVKKSLSDKDEWEVGWNNFSKTTYRNYFKKMGYHVNLYDFFYKENLPKTSDLYRSYSINCNQEGPIIINGTQLIHNFSLMKIDNKL